MIEADKTRSARERLEHSIRRRFSGGMARLYRANPEYLDSEVARKAVSQMLLIMHEVLADLECCEIEDLKTDRRKRTIEDFIKP
jgi:hypothetical protein